MLWILSSMTILKSYPHADVHISDNSGPTNSDLKSSHRFLNLILPKVCCGFDSVSAETVAEGRAGYEWRQDPQLDRENASKYQLIGFLSGE